jgi:tetratricopeptide (TPR) repeat protein
MSNLVEQLVGVDSGERAALIARTRGELSPSEVTLLADRARAAAQADPLESLRLAEIAGELAEALESGRSRAEALRARAVALRAQNRLPEALEAFTASAETARKAGEPLLAAQVRIAAPETLAKLGRFDEALALAAEVEATLRRYGAEEDAAKVVANAGNIYFERECFSEALERWRRALEYFEGQGQTVATARLRMNVANVLTQMNRLPEALEAYASARETLDAAGMRMLAAGAEGNVGYLQFCAGRYTEALRSLSRARDQFAALGLENDVARCDRELADVYLDLNLVPEALESYERVLPIFRGLKLGAEAARVEMGLASAWHTQGRTERAFEALDEAERLFRREGNRTGVGRARLQRAEWLLDLGRLDEAAAAARSARSRFTSERLRLPAARARLLLAEIELKSGGSPLRGLSRLAREAEAEQFLSLQWRIEALLGRAYRDTGHAAEAIRHYRRSVEALERVRALVPGEDFRIAYLKDKSLPYEALLGLLLAQETPEALEEAFRVTERARSRALLELMLGAVDERSEHDPEARRLLRELETLRAQLAWDYGRRDPGSPRAAGEGDRLPSAPQADVDELRRLESEYLRLRQQLQVRSAGPGAAARGAPGIDEIRGALGPGEQLVEYAVVGEELLAFVISRGEFHARRGLCTTGEVKRLAERLRFQWSKFGLGEAYLARHGERMLRETQDALGQLYDLLLRPLEPLLAGGRLAVVPVGALHRVPFHALYAGEGYALDRWEIATAPSAEVLRACSARREPEGAGSLVFAVSDPQLPHVLDEAASLGRLLPHAEVMTEGGATVAAVPREGRFRYLHFATHAVFRQDNPLFSGLRMWDGWLVAADLYRRRLDCSLATLAACHTGSSAVAPGEETIGLARGFLAAGARAVLVSLWPADDAATAELMRDLYSRMEGGCGRAAALGAAQRAVRSRRPHPYYWGAFSLIGAAS